ncbi:MAG: reverse transcriptase domain-containing protein, partial [bacterium]
MPKKNGTVRFITDFRKLNENLERQPYLLPNLQDTIRRHESFSFLTKIDLNMGYYTLELDQESSKLCTIITPWGQFRYLLLPLGVMSAVDLFQVVMSLEFQSIDHTFVYLDDLKTATTKDKSKPPDEDDFQLHLTQLHKALTILQDCGFTINPAKCAWAVQSTDYLGYVFTPDGVQPMQNKVDAMLQIQSPKTRKQVRRFIGLVNYYRDMWPQRSHILAPLTRLTSTKVKFHWGDEEESAFQSMKSLITHDVLLHFPDQSKPFHIYT